ncbi:LacI family DNA-binding transcriptional regulator [Candidatus Njordibacter sp. Uisw_039]|jgi:DNA-binding LacI/PurR family transcriptional regulator|uniref:LacI family DNA-binding transcriptional regulator n=1 Tax=Candidatus Njordibacter sp. Uisw_039 TaxID=3230972 RepID=UPI00359122E5|tara:strand:- start:617 stop:1636 length:1020 start_codon:yes stop_codon:yes gene_type:complete
MSKEKVTSQQVAELAGVSQSAVSRVYTTGASASKKTTDKVHKAATALGYRPNVLARAMVSGKSRIIGLVVAYLENQFYPDAIEKLSTQLQEKGYHVLIFMPSKTAENIDAVVEEILDYQVEGIIVASVALSSQLADRCRSAGVPVVLFNRSQDGEGLSCVTSDNFSGGAKAARFLLAGGHKKIGYIAGWEGASTQRDREFGFTAALQQEGATLYAREAGDFSMEKASEATRRMFSDDRPDAVFVANDHMAFAVMDTLRFELGLRVPEDVSVISYDDVPAAAWPAYNLTTVRQRANQMVRETVRILMEQILGDGLQGQQIAIGSPVIVRGSARIPEGWNS